MEYQDTKDLTPKSPSGSGSGVNGFIRECLKNIPEGKSLRMVDLKDEVMGKFDGVLSGKNKKEVGMRVYIRIGSQYNKLVGKGLKLGKFVDGNGYTTIGR